MSQVKIHIKEKIVKKINSATQINEAEDGNGDRYYAKIIINAEAEKYGLEDAVDFNR